jgi:hypothetical protein
MGTWGNEFFELKGKAGTFYIVREHIPGSPPFMDGSYDKATLGGSIESPSYTVHNQLGMSPQPSRYRRIPWQKGRLPAASVGFDTIRSGPLSWLELSETACS